MRYGKNLRESAVVNLKATSEGSKSSLQTQILRYKYINFLEAATVASNQGHFKDIKKDLDSLVN